MIINCAELAKFLIDKYIIVLLYISDIEFLKQSQRV